jgi:DNA-binding CsgD family transcriptional regulator
VPAGEGRNPRMPAKSRELNGLFHLAEVVPTLRHPIDVLNALDREVAQRLGLRVYGAWRVSVNAGPNAYQPGRNVFMHSSVSKAYLTEFMQLYSKNGASPVGREVRLNYVPLTWSEFTRRTKPTGSDRWFLDLAQRHGMRDGMHCAQGDMLVGFHSKKLLKLNETDRAIINGAAQIAASHLRRIMAAKKLPRDEPVAKLTARELTALRWYSLGEEPAEIAKRMGIAVATVATFLDRARRKLGAKTRAHAVRVAIYGRLIGIGPLLPLLEDLPWF